MRLSLFLVLVGMVMAVPPGVAEGQSVVGPFINVDAGFTERTWNHQQKPPIGFVLFSWTPQLDPATTLYYLRGKCDIDSQEAPSNKVVFQGTFVWGLDTDAGIFPVKTSKSIKNGEGKVALWDLTPQLQELAAENGSFVVAGEFKTTKKLEEFDTLRCELAVLELLDVSNLRRASTAERLDYFRKVATQRGESL